jgi:pimeloyl-ACP methyl ester carboxylesterase
VQETAAGIGTLWRPRCGRRHDVVAPDLPADAESAGLTEYANTVVDAVGDRSGLVVVGQSFGGFTALLVPIGSRWTCWF